MTDPTSPADEDKRAEAIALMEAALALLDQLGLTTPAARLDFVLAEVRESDGTPSTH